MEEFIIAALAGLFAGAIFKKLSDKAQKVPVFQNKIKNYNDILNEAKKAHEIGADSASILLAFTAVESRLRELTSNNDSTYLISHMLSELIERNKINSDTEKLIKQLEKARNETAHSGESKKFSELKVLNYLEKAELIISKLSQSSCSIEHSDLRNVMETIDIKQAGEFRHVCAGCAYELGRLHKRQGRALSPEAIKVLDFSQAQPQRHRNAYSAYKAGYGSH